MLRYLNDMKLQKKLMLTFIMIVFVPVMIVGLFLTGELRQMALTNAMEQNALNVDRVLKRTAEVINVSYDISYRLSYDSRLKDVANRQYESVYEVVSAYRGYPDFREYARLYKEITDIRFYIDNQTLLNNWEFIQPDEGTIRQAWYQQALATNGLISWNRIVDERDQTQRFSLIRKVDFRENDEDGVLVINVNTNLLQSILDQESFETMIVDDQDAIIAANRPGRTGKTLADIRFDASVIAEESGDFDAVVDGQASKILIEQLLPQSSFNGIRVISVFSVESIVRDADRINNVALLVIGISLVIAVVLIYAFSSLISNRLRRLSKHISKVATGNFETSMAIDGRDEIGQLSRQFNAMVVSIDDLMMEIKESNREKSELELRQNEIKFKMLASQINPHFLFNTLESIRMKAHLSGQQGIARVVKMLGRMMRANLEAGKRTVMLRDELDIVQSYLEIQQFRHEERLAYEIICEPDVGDVQVPPLIIQPLVENAVIHGLEKREEGGKVSVRVWRERGEVVISVEDNGLGILPERLQAIMTSFEEREEDDGQRIGIRNVHLRLQLAYGAEYGLAIHSQQGQGTQIQFRVPAEGGAL
ncbi:histidine kinase [Paenibacillus sp. 1P07SE]|uniref:sensor histidine kinase n=1 Tax=Paenibacillus sp. 1P07SE TaxID=3132209 RepID=UPI0039A52048